MTHTDLYPNDESDPSLQDLSERSGCQPRTIRYYVQEGLLPKPQHRGPRATYAPDAVERLTIIRAWQQRGQTLDEIRSRLAQMAPEAIRATALIVRDPATGLSEPSATDPAAAPRTSRSRTTSSRIPGLASVTDLAAQATTWQRYRVADGIEIQVSLPLSMAGQALLARLLDCATNGIE